MPVLCNLQGFGDLGLTKHREKDTVIYRVIFQPPSPSFSPTTQPRGSKLFGPAPPLQASEQFGSQLLRKNHTAHKLTQDPPTHYASCLHTPCFHTYPCCLQQILDHLSATHSKLFTTTQPSSLKLLGPAPQLIASEQHGSLLLRMDSTAHPYATSTHTLYTSCLHTPLLSHLPLLSPSSSKPSFSHTLLAFHQPHRLAAATPPPGLQLRCH